MNKKFWKKNKKKIIITAGLLGIGITTYLKLNSNNNNVEYIKLPIDPVDDQIQKIDEEIFTELAASIEEALFVEGIDQIILDRCYEVPMPKNGHYKNGSYNIMKNVQVLIRNMEVLK